jgi:hypothetical protein
MRAGVRDRISAKFANLPIAQVSQRKDGQLNQGDLAERLDSIASIEELATDLA